jgi:hypothetical protein
LVKVDIIPRGGCFVRAFRIPHGSNGPFTPEYYPIENVLEPLRLLRGVKRLEIGNADPQDLAQSQDTFNDLIRPHLLDLDLISELKSVSEGVTPIFYVFRMYGKLVSYAQAFERNATFREKMDATFDDALARLNPESREQSGRPVYNYSKSLFKSYNRMVSFYHPVERFLELASAATESNNVKEFLKARKEVLDYLER